MTRLSLLAALLVTVQAGAYSGSLCVSKQGGGMYLRCQFNHNQQDWINYRELAYYCANTTVPGSYPDPFKFPIHGTWPMPDQWWSLHGGLYIDPFSYSSHNTVHLWNVDLWIPCENQRDSWKLWTRAWLKQGTNQFIFGMKDATQNITTIGANCANVP